MNIFKFIRKDKRALFLIFIWTVAFIFIFIPFLKFEMIGSSHKINAYPSLSAVCGLLLGPIYGFFAVVLVMLIYFFLNSKAFYFGIYSLIPPALAVISAGVLSEGKWKYSAIILAIGLLIFYLTDVGRVAFYYPSLSILALLLIIIFREKINKLLFNKDCKKIILGALILSFTSVMIDHLYGSILGILYLNLKVEDYIMAIPLSIKERLIMTLMGAFFVIFAVEISKCFLKNATKLREKLLRSYIDEEVKIKCKNVLNVDEELLKKYNVKIPSEEEQKEVLKTLVEVMVLNDNKEEIKRK
ncbi:hypothetical protein JH146_0982 [Methanocaldococcus bathoardescens]|uniref:Uncharacterized protein n=1 Tax=Methanocaldococcus bathoardescens TaxID=1301915 RepID=A0A076LCB3_9EURY|nr:hypothetical protein [Methanocaldococcus bathoardescens]AIJ05826.1 hypothetical protein JH146_0982 [Methanocaldococcus bathoardescens]